MPGTFISDDPVSGNELGPGSYEIHGDWDPDRLEKKATTGPDWKRAYQLERMATMPHLLYREQWEEKQRQKTKLGPGTYEVSEYESLGAKLKKGTPGRGILQTREPRFPEVTKSEVPPPGAYGIPHALKEAMDAKRKSPSTIGILDAGASGNRSLPFTGSHLGPGTYNVKDSIQELTSKVTGLRGPYDLYSGDRSAPPKEGHYAAVRDYNLGPGQYDVRSGIDDLFITSNKQRGKFLKAAQYPAKPHDRAYWMSIASMPPDPANQVAPGTYSVDDKFKKSRSFLHSNPGFLSCSQRQDRRALMFFTGNYNSVGPGRYDIQRIEDSQHINAHTNDFVSKSEARPKVEMAEILRERLRDTNIPQSHKVLADHYATVESACADISKTFKNRSLKIM